MTLIRTLTVSLFISCFVLTAAAQEGKPLTSPVSYDPDADISIWLELMQAPDANFYEVLDAYNQYYATHPKGKGTGWKIFERWAHRMRTRIGPDGKVPAPEQVYESYYRFKADYLATRGPSSNAGDWVEIGPLDVPYNNTGQPTGLGRINNLAFHPTDVNTMWAGAPAGGLWKTTDGGANWVQQNTDQLPTIGVSAIAIDHTNTNVIYTGTGDRDGGDSPGLGVFKSTDGGSTWIQTNNGMGNRTVGMLLMHPTNNAILLAATSGGIYKTSDNGANWTRTSSNTSHYKDMRFKPGDPTTVYATHNGRFWRSTNTGDSWTEITSGVPSNSRAVIGVTPADPNRVYLMCTGGAPFVGLYESTNSGTSFTQKSNSPNILGYSSTGSDSNSQAWYDLCITVSRTDANRLWVGGINVWESANAGTNWTIVAHWVGSGSADPVHADQHQIEINPLNNTIYLANDGGVYESPDNGVTWTDISDDLAVGMFYRIGVSQQERERVVGGTQDNGVALWEPEVYGWATIAGGDGMDCAIDYSDNRYVYSTYIDAVRRSSNYGYGSNATIADQGVNGITESGAWVAPFMLDVTDPETMYLGYKNVWRTTNVRDSPPTWTKISDNLGGSNSSNIHMMSQSQADSSILYVSRSDDSFFRTDNIHAANPVWIDLSANLPITNNPSDLEAHPSNPEVVYVVADNRVWKSPDRGQTWENISGNIPNNISVNTIAIDKYRVEALYVGTDATVHYRDTSLSDWVLFDANLPVVGTDELEIYYGLTDSRLRAATFGRGLWESPLYVYPSALPIANFEADQTTITTGDSIQFRDISANAPESWSWTFTPSSVTYLNGTSSTSENPRVQFNTNGLYDVSLTSTNSNGSDNKTIKKYVQVYSETASPCEGATQNLGGYGMGIFNFQLNTINATSGQPHQDNPNAPEGYVSNYPGTATTLQPSSSYAVSINVGTSYAQFSKIYIDYNNDGDFLDAGEEAFSNPKVTGVHTGTINTPASPAMNQLLRMRVIADWNSIGNACVNPAYGQMEDYAVIFSNPATLTTNTPSAVASTTASCGGNITNDGGSTVTDRGVVWGLFANPTLETNWGYTENGSGTGSYTSALTDLHPNTTYFVRAYAINGTDIAYGPSQTFTTMGRDPVVETVPVNPSYNNALCGGNITDDAGLAITARGVVWDTLANPTLGNNMGYTTDGTGSGLFASTISGLAVNTTYHVRAYATNSYSTTYGGDSTFTTLPPDPNQAKDIVFSSVGMDEMTVSWTNGNRTSRICVINTVNSFTDPVNGTDPPANAVYGGSGEQVIYNGSGNTVTVTGLTEETTYYFRVFEFNGSGLGTDFSTSAADNNPAAQPTYCLPTYSNSPVGTFFQRFVLADIDNSSGSSTYTDFTNVSTSLSAGNSYNVDFQMSYNTMHVDLWIDFNDDAVFDVSEKLVDDLTCPSNQTTSTTISIPSDAAIGSHRLRIRGTWGANGNACNNWNWGEVEDYTITIGARIETNGVTAVTNDQAQLNGNVNASGFTVSNIAFDLGQTTSYGTTITATPSTATGTSDTAISGTATGLQRGIVYHYRLKADVGGETFYGEDQTFMVPPGNVLSFDGIDDYAAAPDHTDYQFGSTGDFSVEFWLYAQAPWTGDPSIVSNKNWASGLNTGWNIALSSGGTGIDVNVADGTNRADLDAGVINDNEWHHVAATFDRNGNVTLYIDGRQQASASMASVGDIDNAFGIVFGQDGTTSYTNFLRGRVDEIRLWNDVRTLNEIRDNMHLALNGDEANLVGYWRMDTDGTIAYDAVNNNHANLANETDTRLAKFPLGYGTTARQTVTGSGSYTFGATGLQMTFPGSGTYPNGVLSVTRLEGSPDADPGSINSTSRAYWVIRNFGSNSTFSELTSLQLSNIGEVSSAVASSPNQAKLFKRNSTDTDAASWSTPHAFATAATAGADGDITFGAGNSITSFSQLIVGDNGNPLPIELTSFHAVPVDQQWVKLNWETASEINHDYFAVERSADNRQFSELERVPGVPWSNTVRSYETWDYDPLPGISYYRLRSTDLDGESSLSKVVAVDLNEENNVFIGPNPVSEGGKLFIATGSSDAVTVTIYNDLGQEVREQQINGSELLSLDGMTAGIYTFRITSKTQLLKTGKLVVTKTD